MEISKEIKDRIEKRHKILDKENLLNKLIDDYAYVKVEYFLNDYNVIDTDTTENLDLKSKNIRKEINKIISDFVSDILIDDF